MKRTVSAFTLFLVFAIVLSFFAATPLAAHAIGQPDTGRSFNKGNALKMPVTFDAIPKSYEAWIKLDTSLSGRGGVVMGTYKETSNSPSFNIEIKENGNPRVYYNDGRVATDKLFKKVDVRRGEWLHLAITHEDTELRCYVNGELAGSFDNVPTPTFAPTRAMMIGGDYRTGNDQYNMQYFKGAIKEVAVFSDVRTAEEIASDYAGVDCTDENLLAAYSLTENCYDAVDRSTNGYHIVSPWVDEADIEIPTDYAYSFMIVGDTQIITDQHPEYLHCIYDYIVDNVEAKKVKYVFGLGDITDNDTQEEWDIAKNEIAKLDGVVRYSIIRGNHDIYSASKSLAKESRFDAIYGSPDSPYASQYTYFYDGGAKDNFRARNTIHFFEAGGIKYMNVALDYGADDKVLAWAGDIIRDHPYHNVIVSTHCYLNSDKDYYTSNDNSYPERDYGGSANNGDEIWEKLVSKHPNIVMVLCGHAPTPDIVVREVEGDAGNKIKEVLIDPQGLDANATVSPTGLVATFYFDETGKNITTTYYSTIKQKYYKAKNNFTFDLERIEEPIPGVTTYTVKFKDDEGNIIEEALYHFGDDIQVPEAPEKPADSTYMYNFVGWDKDITVCTGHAVYTAVYEKILIDKPEAEDKEDTPSPDIPSQGEPDVPDAPEAEGDSNEEEGGFFAAIAAFFTRIIEWFKSLFVFSKE